MKRTYPLLQQYIAHVLLVSFFLQSCGGEFDNHPLIPTQEEQIASIQANTQSIILPSNIDPLVDQVLMIQGGHNVTFYKEAGKLKADVEINAPQGFSKRYDGLCVYIEQGAALASLPLLDEKSQNRRIHLQPAQAENRARVVIYKGAGLAGGMLEGEEEEIEIPIKEEQIDNTLSMCYAALSISEGENEQIQGLYIEARNGNADAQNALGDRYFNGEGVKQDIEKAFEWYLKAADQGNDKAQYILLQHYGILLEVPKEENEEIFYWARRESIWLKKAAKNGYMKPQCDLGLLYYLRDDFKRAIKWYKRAADQGHSAAQGMLGKAYSNGDGVEKDDREAFKWYLKSAENKHPVSEFMVALSYHMGLGTPKNAEEAIRWYTIAANKDHTNAQSNLASIYEHGEGVEQDGRLAVKWYENAANDGGDEEAAYRLGFIYEKGMRHIDIDKEKAMDWYLKAAEDGYGKAAYKLGCIYEEGHLDQTIDPKKAIEWYEDAAEDGYGKAAYKLGCIYEEGHLDQTIDPKRAVYWYTRAARERYVKAAYKLGCIYEEGHLDQTIDPKRALKWYRSAAGNGYGEATYKLGCIYEEGKWVKKDYKQAHIYYREAATQYYKGAEQALLDYDTDSSEEEESEEDSMAVEEQSEWEKDISHISEAADLPSNNIIQSKLEELNHQLKTNNSIDFSKYKEFSIALYRGIHYLPHLFPTKEERNAFRHASQIGEPLYSSSAYEATELNFLTFTSTNPKHLESNAQAIVRALDHFRSCFPESYHKFHEVYSNDHKKFHKMLSDPLQQPDGADSQQISQSFFNYVNFLGSQVKNMPDFKMGKAILRNPHVSFSLTPRHAVKYALGDKSFHNPEGDIAELLTPNYDAYGKPKHPYLGKVYVALLSLKDYSKLDPYLVPYNHALGNIKINSHHQKNVLKENEVTVAGYLPKNLVVTTKDIRCPTFSHTSYPSIYLAKYGMSEKKYKAYREIFKKQEKINEDGLYDYIAIQQDKLILEDTKQEAIKQGRILIYPGFEKDFILFPLSTRAATIYAEITQGKEHSICIFPEGGKENLTDEEILYVCQKFIGNRNIEQVLIRDFDFKIDRNGFDLFSKVLLNNNFLTTLVLENISKVKKVESNALKRAKEANNQKILNQHKDFMSTVYSVNKLAESLEKNQALTSLSLKGNPSVGEAYAAISAMLTKNRVLRTLNLISIGLSAKGGEKLQAIFTGNPRKNTTLIEIHLDGNPIKDSCKKLILNGIAKNTKKRPLEEKKKRTGELNEN